MRRQVAQRTLQLQHEIRERERAERQHAIEAERSRIARDLHDDLGSSLTEINVLASTGQRPRSGDRTHPALFKAIADKARASGGGAGCDRLGGGSGGQFTCNRWRIISAAIPVSFFPFRHRLPFQNSHHFSPATLDGQIRHEVLMVVKETLNNIVRHADATEVEFQMAWRMASWKSPLLTTEKALIRTPKLSAMA